MRKAPRSVYEYMGNKKWLQAKKADEAAGQALLPGIGEPTLPLDLDSRFTLRPTLEWCKRKAGVEAFDLDVAACDEAHCAEHYLTVADDGLKQDWVGRVWCNPPYSDIEPWVVKAWDEMHRMAELVAMLLPATRTEQPWWQQHVEPFRDGELVDGIRLSVHFVPGRQNFGIPGNPLGLGVGSPPFGVVLLVWRVSVR